MITRLYSFIDSESSHCQPVRLFLSIDSHFRRRLEPKLCRAGFVEHILHHVDWQQLNNNSFQTNQIESMRTIDSEKWDPAIELHNFCCPDSGAVPGYICASVCLVSRPVSQDSFAHLVVLAHFPGNHFCLQI